MSSVGNERRFLVPSCGSSRVVAQTEKAEATLDAAWCNGNDGIEIWARVCESWHATSIQTSIISSGPLVMLLSSPISSDEVTSVFDVDKHIVETTGGVLEEWIEIEEGLGGLSEV